MLQWQTIENSRFWKKFPENIPNFHVNPGKSGFSEKTGFNILEYLYSPKDLIFNASMKNDWKLEILKEIS